MHRQNREATLWMPAWRHVKAHVAISSLQRVLARADQHLVESGESARLQRVFNGLPANTPVAALTCEWDTSSAGNACWLRADPGFVRPDMASVRLMATGELGLSADETAMLFSALEPLFVDEGLSLIAPVPSRWYVLVPDDWTLPEFHTPQETLGDDLFAHLPEGELGRVWRRLLNEAQVILHNHPINQARSAGGKVPVNSLWFWGEGRLPEHIQSQVTHVFTNDVMLRAVAAQAGITLDEVAEPKSLPAGSLVDFRFVQQLDSLIKDWLIPLIARVEKRQLEAVILDFGDGLMFRYSASHRWRFWRKGLPL